MDRTSATDSSKAILLVDDDAIIAIAEQELLERNGYVVEVVHTGEDAVGRVAQSPDIDLILMDIDLGDGIDGTEAATRILKIRDLPIVFLTSHSEREFVDRVKAISRYGYVLKSAGGFVLIESITTAFDLFHAQRSLAVQKERLSAAERLAHLGGWEIDLGTNRTYWSDEFFRICGLGPGSVEPSTELGLSLIHPDDRERARSALNHAIESGEPYDMEKRIMWPNGTVRHVHSIGEVQRDEHGRAVRVVGSFLDITDRVNAMAESEAARARFRTLFEGSPTALVEQDCSAVLLELRSKGISTGAELRKSVTSNPQELARLMSLVSLSDANPAALELFEVASVEELDPLAPESPSPDVLRDWGDALVSFFATGESKTEAARRTIRGKPIVCSIESRIAPGCEHDWSRVFVAVTDITRQIRALEALERSERRFRYVLKHDPNAIAIYDKDLRYIIASDRYLRDYGVSEKDVIGKHHYEVFPEIPERWREIHRRVLQGETLKSDHDQFTRPDGNITYNRWECRPWYGADGEVEGMITYTEVTTERVIAQQQKDIMFEELRHRVKNNLNLVSALIDLKDKAIGSAADLTDIANSVQAIQRTYDKLNEEGDAAHTNIARYLEDVLEGTVRFGSSTYVEMTLDLPDLTVRTKDAVALGMIVNELATNALKHGFSAGEHAWFRVELRPRTDPGEYELVVSNGGRRFPEGIDIHSSTSLGLSLISALTRQLHGTIELQRSPHPVFTFHVHLGS